MGYTPLCIGCQSELSDKFTSLLSDELIFLQELFPATIKVCIGRPHSPTYWIYIGKDVPSVTKNGIGVELPPSVLESQESFRREVLYRIRNEVACQKIANSKF